MKLEEQEQRSERERQEVRSTVSLECRLQNINISIMPAGKKNR